MQNTPSFIQYPDSAFGPTRAVAVRRPTGGGSMSYAAEWIPTPHRSGGGAAPPHRPALRADRARGRRARRACGPCSARGGGARGAVRAGPLPPPAPRGAAPVNGRLRTGRQGHCTGREGHPAVGRRRSRQPNHSKKITVNPPAPLAPGIHMTAPRDGSRGGRPADRPRASSSTPKLGDSQRTERGARDPPRRSVESFADELAIANPRFDRLRFIKHVTEDPS
jgi:hypothetical protein